MRAAGKQIEDGIENKDFRHEEVKEKSLDVFVGQGTNCWREKKARLKSGSSVER